MKVLLLSPSLSSAGGIQRYSAILLRALKEELGEKDVRCIAIAEPSHHNGNGARLSAASKLRFASQALREALEWKPDLVICTHLALGPIGRAIAMTTRRPYWIVVHGIEAWAKLSSAKARALRHADRVIATNAFNQAEVVKRHGIDRARTAILPCTLDEALMTVEPSRNGHFHRIAADSRVVLTVGRLASSERYKGHDVMLRALPSVISQLSNLIYVIAGDGDDRPRLEELARELGLAEHVVFTGGLGDSELAALYRRSDVFALPARTVLDGKNPKGEGFGIVFLEAMAFGKPVIGPNYGAPAELIRHGNTGLLVDPESPASVADALLQLLSQPALASQIGKAASEWVQANFSYDCLRRQLRHLVTPPALVARC